LRSFPDPLTGFRERGPKKGIWGAEEKQIKRTKCGKGIYFGP